MGFGACVAAGVLAAVFTVSGTGKLRRPYAAALALRRFGLLRRPGPLAGRLAGAVEVAAALAVAARPGQRPGYLPAMVLLALFAVLITRSLMRGERFSCHCFGEHGGELSGWSLVRVGALLALAAGAAGVARGVGTETWIAGLCVGVCLTALAFMVAGLRRTAPFSTGLTDA
jgi:hypothetical protein